MLLVEKVKKNYGGNEIIREASFNAVNNERVAIVGNNGTGKSTLLKIIYGEIDSDGGRVEFAVKKPRIGLMPQLIEDYHFPYDSSVRDFLKEGRPVDSLMQKITEIYEQLADENVSEEEKDKKMLELEELSSEFEYFGGYNADAELDKIISGVGFDENILNKKIKELSGGQKSKIAFVRLLYSMFDILILDEPTNHLDVSTKDWVMDYLCSQKTPVITVSHDEEFLNRVVNKIVYLNHFTKKSEIYMGNYEKFLKVAEEKNIALDKLYKTQQKQASKIEAYLDSMKGTSGKRKIQAQSHEKKFEKFKQNMIEQPPVEKGFEIKLKPLREESGLPLAVKDLNFSYDGKHNIIKKASFEISLKERFVIVGDNGAGKTTLLKLLAGKLTPASGDIKFGSKTDVGYYAQEHEEINQENTMLDELKEIGGNTEAEVRGFLGRFGFKGEKVFQTISTLSPGERSRFAILKLCLNGSNLLLLDEPTNHLDIKTKKAVSQFLKNYGGVVIVVSHEVEFLHDLGIERMLVLPECKLRPYSEKTILDFANEK